MIDAELLQHTEDLAAAEQACVYVAPRYRSGARVVVIHRFFFKGLQDRFHIRRAAEQRQPRPGKGPHQGTNSKATAVWEPFVEPFGRVLVTPHRSSVPYVALNWLRPKPELPEWMQHHGLHLRVEDRSPLRQLLHVSFVYASVMRKLRKKRIHPSKERLYTTQDPLPALLPITHNQETGRRLQLYLGDRYRGSPASLHFLVVAEDRPLPPFEVQARPRPIHVRKVRRTRTDPIVAATPDESAIIYFPLGWKFPKAAEIAPELPLLAEAFDKGLRGQLLSVFAALRETYPEFPPLPDWLGSMLT